MGAVEMTAMCDRETGIAARTPSAALTRNRPFKLTAISAPIDVTVVEHHVHFQVWMPVEEFRQARHQVNAREGDCGSNTVFYQRGSCLHRVDSASAASSIDRRARS